MSWFRTHVGCAINLHTIINSGLIRGGHNLSNRQTVFLLLVDSVDKEHKDPDTIDLEAPRLAQHMHKAWKKHRNSVYWVDTNVALRKGLKFYQTRSNAIILHETLPAYCIPKVVLMETGEITKKYLRHFGPKISLKHDWMKKLVSEAARQPEGEVVRQSKNSQPSQPNPNHERSILNAVDIDFRIPGLPHYVVKQADNYRVRELVKKIENHPHRKILQRDLQQNNACNRFSEKSKKWLRTWSM